MADDIKDSRVAIPFIPSLSHLDTVKVAISLFNDFGGVKSSICFREIKTRNREAYITLSEVKEGTYKKTKKDLSFIPVLLRKKVIKSLHGMQFEARYWELRHQDLLKLDEECVFYWRSDGTIDTIKTVQKIVLDENIDIRNRFEIACKYCLEGSIQTLWTKMKLCGEAENFDGGRNKILQFWMKWLSEKSNRPWRQAAAEFLKNTDSYSTYRSIRWSSFFPFLRPEERHEFLFSVSLAETDDFWLCLSSVTNKEEEAILLRGNAYKVLDMVLIWPLHSMFLETFRKLWKYIDDINFKNVVYRILSYKNFIHCSDFYDLFEEFWEESPKNLKKSALEDTALKKEINSCLGGVRLKRDAFYNEVVNLKKKRKIGG